MSVQLPDLSRYDLSRVEISKDEIRRILPHRFEFEQVDYVCVCDIPGAVIVGVREIRSDEFWARGHIPGKPIFPGVLMIEACAQLCALLYKKALPELGDRFVALGGVDSVRYRGMVGPGDRLTLVGKGLMKSARGLKCYTWALKEGKIVFEAEILGVPV